MAVLRFATVREATIEDVGGILALIKPLEDSGILVPRSREQLELEISFFDVMMRDGTVIACSALFPFPQNQMAEFSCVAVHPDYRSAVASGKERLSEWHLHPSSVRRKEPVRVCNVGHRQRQRETLEVRCAPASAVGRHHGSIGDTEGGVHHLVAGASRDARVVGPSLKRISVSTCAPSTVL
jgi:hypothetical protein